LIGLGLVLKCKKSKQSFKTREIKKFRVPIWDVRGKVRLKKGDGENNFERRGLNLILYFCGINFFDDELNLLF